MIDMEEHYERLRLHYIDTLKQKEKLEEEVIQLKGEFDSEFTVNKKTIKSMYDEVKQLKEVRYIVASKMERQLEQMKQLTTERDRWQGHAESWERKANDYKDDYTKIQKLTKEVEQLKESNLNNALINQQEITYLKVKLAQSEKETDRDSRFTKYNDLMKQLTEERDKYQMLAMTGKHYRELMEENKELKVKLAKSESKCDGHNWEPSGNPKVYQCSKCYEIK